MSWVYHFLFFVLFFICSWLYHCVRNYSVFLNVRRVSAIWGNFYWFLCFGITKRQKNNLTIFILTRDWQCLMWLDGFLWRVDFVRKISSSLRDSSRRKDIFVVILLFLSYLLCIGTQRGVVEEKSDWLSWHCFFFAWFCLRRAGYGPFAIMAAAAWQFKAASWHTAQLLKSFLFSHARYALDGSKLNKTACMCVIFCSTETMTKVVPF